MTMPVKKSISRRDPARLSSARSVSGRQLAKDVRPEEEKARAYKPSSQIWNTPSMKELGEFLQQRHISSILSMILLQVYSDT